MTTGIDRTRRLAIALVIALLAIASWFKPLDSMAIEQVDTGMKAAFASFATARAINGAISLLQSLQVGVGVSANPGELLDPVNDLIEQFSNLMLAATVAFGVQKVLLAIGGHVVLPLLISVAAALWIASAAMSRPAPRWLGQVIAVLLMVRFAVPLASVGADLLADRFLAPTYTTAQQSLSQLAGQAASAGSAAQSSETWSEWARRWSGNATDIGGQIERFKVAAGRVAEDLTDLIVVFLLRTLVFPLALLWLLYQALLVLLRPESAARQ